MHIPDILFEEDKYKLELSANDKIIYAVLEDLHINFENDSVWVEVTRKELSDKLGISEATIKRSFKKLTEIGLIAETRRGLGLSNKIYLLECSKK